MTVAMPMVRDMMGVREWELVSRWAGRWATHTMNCVQVHTIHGKRRWREPRCTRRRWGGHVDVRALRRVEEIKGNWGDR